ncbi:MAG TPA: hypothetical protein VFN97_03640 [Actinospica sp.]|nr:hypothetical protein [Actinospica sp.]
MIGISEGMVLAERYRLVRRHEDLGIGEFWGGVDQETGSEVWVCFSDRPGLGRIAQEMQQWKAPATPRVLDEGEVRLILDSRTLGAGGAQGRAATHVEVVVEFAVQEPALGKPLPGRIVRRPLAPAEALAIVAAMAGALDEALSAGYSHGWISAASAWNLRRRVCLVDLVSGLAMADDVKIDVAAQATGFYAPERVAGGGADEAADVFALGWLLYASLVGMANLEAYYAETMAAAGSSNTAELLTLWRHRTREHVSMLLEGDSALAVLLLGALAERPADRPTLAAFHTAAAEAARGLAGAAALVAYQPKRRPAAAAAAMAAEAAELAGAVAAGAVAGAVVGAVAEELLAAESGSVAAGSAGAGGGAESAAAESGSVGAQAGAGAESGAAAGESAGAGGGAAVAAAGLAGVGVGAALVAAESGSVGAGSGGAGTESGSAGAGAGAGAGSAGSGAASVAAESGSVGVASESAAVAAGAAGLVGGALAVEAFESVGAGGGAGGGATAAGHHGGRRARLGTGMLVACGVGLLVIGVGTGYAFGSSGSQHSATNSILGNTTTTGGACAPTPSASASTSAATSTSAAAGASASPTVSALASATWNENAALPLPTSTSAAVSQLSQIVSGAQSSGLITGSIAVTLNSEITTVQRSIASGSGTSSAVKQLSGTIQTGQAAGTIPQGLSVQLNSTLSYLSGAAGS